MYAGQVRGSSSGRTAIRGRSKKCAPAANVPQLITGDSRLLGLLSGVDRGFHHILVLLEPRLGSLAIVATRFSASVLYRDELVLVEPEIVDKRVGHRVIVGKIFIDYRGDFRGLVEVALGVLRVLEVAEVELGAHRMRAPGREHEFLFVSVEPLHLSEHRGRARRLVLEREVVLGDYVLLDLRGDNGARLDADDPFGSGLIQIGDAVYALHVAGDRQTEGCRALVPGLEVLDVVLDLGEQLRVVRHPDVLEGVEFAAGDALEQQPDVEGFQLYLFVVEIFFQNHLRQVRDGDVLRPPDVPQSQGPARGGRSPTTAASAARH